MLQQSVGPAAGGARSGSGTWSCACPCLFGGVPVQQGHGPFQLRRWLKVSLPSSEPTEHSPGR